MPILRNMGPIISQTSELRSRAGWHCVPRDGRRRGHRYGSDRFDFEDDPDAWLGYWYQVRQPLPILVFLAPLLAAYELGIAYLGGAGADAARTGIDRWVRQALTRVGLGGDLVLPLTLVGILTAWLIVAGPRTWRLRAVWLVGMAAESLALGLGLIGLSRLVDRGIAWLEAHPVLLAAGPGGGTEATLLPLVGYLGAGIYEEAVFRLALLPILYVAFRIIQAPDLLAGTLAVTGSALAFSVAHHAGLPGEPFTWYAFIFRWLAGIVFAWIFIVRGFGIAVGAHVAYDVLVGYAGWAA